MDIPVVENVLKLNDEVAALNREALHRHGVVTIDLMGSVGCGKTALLEATLRRLGDKLRIAVIAGDLTTTRDAQRLGALCPRVVQINTGRSCHLDANQVRQALARLDLSGLDLLVIENVGNLICPVGFDLGQDFKVAMFAVSEGDDKPAKHPYMVTEATALVLNKTDLLPHVPFNMDQFRADVAHLHPRVPLLTVSALRGEIEPWLDWLRAAVATAKSPQKNAPTA
jgi:hydrogenase nickel incorporation protein HypB